MGPTERRGRVSSEIARRQVAVTRLLGDRPVQDRHELRMFLSERRLETRRRIVYVSEQRRNRCLALVGHLPGQHLEEHAPERVDVGAGVARFSGDLLRSHVIDRADHCSLDGKRGQRIAALREPEVRQIRVLLTIPDREQDVPRLDVAVHEPAGMCGIERERDLRQQLDSPGWTQGAVLDHQLAKVGAVDVFHGEEQHAVLLARVVDPDHVGVFKRSGDLHLALEALAELLILGQLRSQHLERVGSVQPDIGYAIHHPHRALPSYTQKLWIRVKRKAAYLPG